MATLQVLATLMVLVAICSAAPKKPTLKIPDECKGGGFCPIKPEGYDEMQDTINKLLNSKFFAQNMGDRIGANGTEMTEEFSSKDDWHNCPYVKKTEKMYMYIHSNDSTSGDYLIQNDMLNQPVDSVTCLYNVIEKERSENEQCFHHFGLNSFNLKSKCELSETYKNFFVYDTNTNQIVIKTLPVPCCCTCKITSTL
ncbi:uncharacterized protein LOC118268113 [Spodoptera frugiperda]|uniref:SFRICE_010944 n=1 Tax=Spodoptera frugiperda TaxID=7108 RepID=A0A2H1VTF5_SPOFR|nr:uncharacterized protein LOC118268113 [Spodoptera frugiperda]